ncbi:hypothetical protein P3T27_006303 [Kitasatospora sp. MAA19]|uniref:hypothetical protein n=1 Tax=unclassified Kitasatospora TaxID=2633591 RepID=UPI0024762F7A|nr:hypothetical protein [Kitasatospora sp. MAA19]MDH6709555.1 hypothetical protein [Kitasatospora sp. MAA19]
MNKTTTALATLALLASAALTATPAQAADLPQVCTSKHGFDNGSFYCGGAYGDGESLWPLRTGDWVDFVIGLDHAVWFRTTTSNWNSLGGYFTGKVTFSKKLDDLNFTINALGSDGVTTWSRDRTHKGFVTAWYVKG